MTRRVLLMLGAFMSIFSSEALAASTILAKVTWTSASGTARAKAEPLKKVSSGEYEINPPSPLKTSNRYTVQAVCGAKMSTTQYCGLVPFHSGPHGQAWTEA